MLKDKKILFIGNIAQNGYLITKFLRKHALSADLLIYSYTHIMGQPEWEDAEINGNPPHWDVNWKRYVKDKYHRPDWIYEIRARSYSKIYTLFAKLSKRQMYRYEENRIDDKYARELILLSKERLKGINDPVSRLDIEKAMNYCNYPGIPKGFLDQYDIIIGSGVDAVLPLLLAPKKKHIAFEHGTMRDLPFEKSFWGRLLALAYTQAHCCIITNPDCIVSARKMLLSNYVFLPHPVDYKYSRNTSEKDNSIIKKNKDFRIFSPARHDWDIKGNEKILKAFADFISKTESSNSRLYLLEWGNDVDKSKRLINELKIDGYVLWKPVVCGQELSKMYQCCDVVLDQFILGVFGSITPQALACGKPVITSYSREKNGWAFKEPPPILKASNEKDIAISLFRLYCNSDQIYSIGKAGKAWYEKHHSPEYVSKRLKDLLERVS